MGQEKKYFSPWANTINQPLSFPQYLYQPFLQPSNKEQRTEKQFQKVGLKINYLNRINHYLLNPQIKKNKQGEKIPYFQNKPKFNHFHKKPNSVQIRLGKSETKKVNPQIKMPVQQSFYPCFPSPHKELKVGWKSKERQSVHSGEKYFCFSKGDEKKNYGTIEVKRQLQGYQTHGNERFKTASFRNRTYYHKRILSDQRYELKNKSLPEKSQVKWMKNSNL